jgi:hypothetical protein
MPSFVGEVAPHTDPDLHDVREGRAPPPPSLATCSGCADDGLQKWQGVGEGGGGGATTMVARVKCHPSCLGASDVWVASLLQKE